MIRGCVATILATAGVCLTSCSTSQIAQFEAKVGAKRCTMDGVAVGSPDFERCVAGYIAGWQQEKELNRVGVATALGAGIAAQSAKQQGRTSALSTGPASLGRPPTQSGVTPMRLCPNASNCFLAPDGTYHAAPPQLAPNGTYVGGTPRLAPNGQYVGGSGTIILCPDGSYVTGTRCVLTADGRYVGGQR